MGELKARIKKLEQCLRVEKCWESLDTNEPGCGSFYDEDPKKNDCKYFKHIEAFAVLNDFHDEIELTMGSYEDFRRQLNRDG